MVLPLVSVAALRFDTSTSVAALRFDPAAPCQTYKRRCGATLIRGRCVSDTPFLPCPATVRVANSASCTALLFPGGFTSWQTAVSLKGLQGQGVGEGPRWPWSSCPRLSLFLSICLSVSICLCCLLYTSPSPRDWSASRMPSSA